MLRAYTQQDDIIVGSPVANRHYKGIENLLGFFVNTLPFRSIIDSNRLVVDYILNVSQGIIDLQMHQDVPLEKIVAELNIPKDPSQSPLFQVLFGVQSFGKENFCPWLEEYKPKADSTAAFTTPYAKFNLSTMMDDGGAEIKGVFNYATDIFEESTVKCFLSTYLIILKQFVQLDDKKNCIKISDINFFDQEEYNKIVYEWNHTRKKMDSNKTIHELFEEQVEKTPESIAVVYENKKLTYRALNEKANRLAHYLRTHGVGPETLVPIACERSLEMIVGIMGILKAGGAYVPLDPAYPMERQEYILNETKAAILLTHSSLIKQLPRRFGIIVELDQLDELISDYPVGNPEHLSGPDNGVYVIYTSGSTGKPKGVLSLHRGCVNRLLWMKDYCGISSTDRLLQKTSFAFDVSVWELLMPLVVGASVVFAKPGGHKDPDYLIELINTHKITLIHFVPSMLQEFISHDELTLSSLRQVICSGEALSTDLANQCRQKLPHAELYNFYGPTEASIEVSFYHCLNQQNGHSIPIGKPIWNTSLYILDDALHPVPVGVIGELYIGGTGLARGYLNDPELTNERFIKNPFAQSEEKEENHNTRLYRTGDLCRYLKNGNIEYIGRIDHQVKIDGFRIELGEIESFLLSHPSIREAAVLAREDNRGNKRLTVYYIINPDACIDVKSLRDYLRSKLPDYMIPSVFVMLKKMPLMANGKLDRKALPEPNFVDEDNYLAPTKNLEILIQRIWSDILGIPVPHLSINKNFFDLGGSSLLVLKLKSRIEQALGKKVLKVMDLFKYPTIKSLSDFLTIGFNEEVPEHFSIKPDGKASQHEIAVIAMSGAFSGSKDIQHFWSNLLNGKSCVSRLSQKECEAINVSKAKLEHENYLGVGGLVEDADKFDPEFWGISVNDAKLMDPQIRKFLEHSYHALEYGGYINRRGGAKIGVFAGMNQGQYYNLNKNSPTFAKLSEWEKRSLSDPFQLATRVSYLLGLTGVSLTINTACSTSLVTIIEACKNLALGVCDAALAGGVAFTMPEDFGDIAEEGMIFSPDGCCRVFDKQANGTVRGSGVGVVLLKPLQKAREDKDPILAVIKGYAVNNDGNRKVGYTAPSPLGQVECISQAIEQAQVSPASIGYFECHGTGTTFGDAIEITALQEVVAKARNNAGSSCYLGSVKANIGHADTAAGVAGFIKGCKMLDEKMLPPQINYSRPNENLDFKNAHLSILTEKQRWEANGMFARRVGVSSFGIGGTNAHVVLEEYASPENSAILTISSEKNNQNPLCIVPISAKSKEAYREYCLALNHFIEAFPDIALIDIALALQHYREEFSVRNFFIGDSKSQLQEYLLSGTPPFEVPPAIKPSILQHKIAKEESSDLFSFYQAIGKLWCSGFSVTWELIDNIESVKKANSLLPGYSFQKLRCWLETEEGIDPLSCLSLSAKTRCKEVNKADVIEGEIIQAFSEVLGCSSIDKQSNFFALGGDSLSALRLAKKLSEIFGVKVSAGIVLKHDSIEKLISYWKNTSIKKSFEPSFIGKGEL